VPSVSSGVDAAVAALVGRYRLKLFGAANKVVISIPELKYVVESWATKSTDKQRGTSIYLS